MERVTKKAALAAEEDLLADYGVPGEEARRLIDDSRKAGGLDALLRRLARERGVEELHRSSDPEED